MNLSTWTQPKEKYHRVLTKWRDKWSKCFKILYLFSGGKKKIINLPPKRIGQCWYTRWTRLIQGSNYPRNRHWVFCLGGEEERQGSTSQHSWRRQDVSATSWKIVENRVSFPGGGIKQNKNILFTYFLFILFCQQSQYPWLMYSTLYFTPDVPRSILGRYTKKKGPCLVFKKGVVWKIRSYLCE